MFCSLLLLSTYVSVGLSFVKLGFLAACLALLSSSPLSPSLCQSVLFVLLVFFCFCHCLFSSLVSLLSMILLLQDDPSSVRLRFRGGTVRAVPVFGSGGSSAKRGFLCFSAV